MRIAIISDIHSNIEALQAVLDEIDTADVSTIINLGDLVGYNASPSECVELVQQRQIVTIFQDDNRTIVIKYYFHLSLIFLIQST